MGIAFVAILPAQSSLANVVSSLILYSMNTHPSDERSVSEFVSLVHLLHALLHGSWDNTTCPAVTRLSIVLDAFPRQLLVAPQAHMLQASEYP